MLAGLRQPASLRTEGYLAITEEYLADPHLGLSEPYDEDEIVKGAHHLFYAVAGRRTPGERLHDGSSAAAQDAARRAGALPLLNNALLPDRSHRVLIAGSATITALVQRNRASQDAAHDAGLLHGVLALVMHGLQPHEDIGCAACAALGALVMSHADNQAFVHSRGGLERLASMAARSIFRTVRLRALHALSCLAAGNGPLREEIVARGGVAAALELLPDHAPPDVLGQRPVLQVLAFLRGFVTGCASGQREVGDASPAPQPSTREPNPSPSAR